MNNARAFTLVELMVVVAILLLLVVVLLPSLNKAQELAAVTSCGSNLRQLQLATTAYAADNYNLYPPCPQAITLNWRGGVDGKDGPGITRLDQSLLWPYFQDPDLLLCPIFDSLSDDDAIRSYSMNWNAGSNPPGSDNGNSSVGTINKVRNPAQFGLFTEENNWGFEPYSNVDINDADFVCENWPDQDTIATYHLPEADRYANDPLAYVPQTPDDLLNTGLGNVAFADGHVDLVKTTMTQSVMFNNPANYNWPGMPIYHP